MAFYGFRGGSSISRVMLNLINGMAALPLHVDLLLHHTAIRHLHALDPRVHLIPLGINKSLSGTLALGRYLNDMQPDVLLALRDKANRRALQARRFTGSATRIVMRAGIHHSMRMQRLSPFQRWRRRHRLRTAYRANDRIVANAVEIRDDVAALTNLPSKSIRWVPDPVVPPNWKLPSNARAPHPWFQSPDPPVILGMGPLTAAQDFPTLIAAVARVRRKRPCRLVILGEGRQRSHLQHLAHTHGMAGIFDLPGDAANPYAYLARSAVFVLSAAREDLPHALIEALAVGTPSVATDCSFGPRKVLAGGHAGPLVPVGDAASMARAIEAMLDTPPDRARLAEAAAPFQTDVNIRGYLAALQLEAYVT